MTVHDLNFLHNGLNPLHRRVKLWRTLRLVKQAQHFNFISHSTRNDVCTALKKHVKGGPVIYNGVMDLWDAPMQPCSAAGEPGYLFHIARMTTKKNTHLLIQMMDYLPEYRLVLAGNARQSYMKRLLRLAAGRDNVVFTGTVSQAEKSWLLRHSAALLFPSLSEGFGLPVVESMLMKRPAIVSRLTSLPEIVGEEGYFFDDLTPAAMADTVRRSLQDFADDPAKGDALRKHALQYNWATAVNDYIGYYKEILSGNPD